ncbi:MAG: TonB-dependent receptor plug domain-containing protein [Bacteroidales bacterium]
MKSFITLLIFLNIIPFWVSAQNVESLKEKTERFLHSFPQQKAYLHFDKQNYFAGDDIWFKAYVVSAIDHKPDTLESTIYVKLLDAKDLLVKREIIRLEMGYGNGDFSIPDSLPEGNYVIKAYTPYMLNFSGDFIFSQNIFIENPEAKNYINRRTRRENRRINRDLEKMADEFNFDIYKEAGSLVYDLPGKVTYHAYDGLGEGINVNAELIDGSGNLVTKFKTFTEASGRGVATFTPIAGEKYLIRYDPPNGRSRSIQLSDIKTEGYILSVKHLEEKIEITVGTAGNSSLKPYLALHTRGQIHSFEQIVLPDNMFKKEIYYTELPSGISVVSLFDEDANVLAERLFFIFPESTDDISLQTENTTANTIEITLQAPAWAEDSQSFSAVVSGIGSEKAIDLQKNILSEIYLGSDITTLLKNPARFFVEQKDYHNEVDAIMLTSNWERFNWTDILEDNTPSVRFRRLDGFPVFGNIEPTEESKEFDRYNFELTLRVDDEMLVRSTRTNSQGDFKFDSLKVQGVFKAEIGVLGLQGSNAGFIELFPDILESDDLSMNMYFRDLPQTRGSNWSRIPYEFRKQSDRRKKIRDNLTYHYGSPDQVIYLKENDERYRNMRDVLSTRVSGLSIEGNTIILRGPSSMVLSNQPLLLVDGQRYSSFQFLNLSPVEISHVEVFKGTSSSIFGIRGANGAIVAHTRRSSLAQRLIFEYLLSGYYIPRDFAETATDKTNLFFDHPSYQHTLHWEPYVNFDQNGSKKLRISIPEQLEELHFILEGVDSDGRIIHYHKLLDL